MKFQIEVTAGLNEKDEKPQSFCDRNKHKLFPNNIVRKYLDKTPNCIYKIFRNPLAAVSNITIKLISQRERERERERVKFYLL